MEEYTVLKFLIKQAKEKQLCLLRNPNPNRDKVNGYVNCCNDILDYITYLEKENS